MDNSKLNKLFSLFNTNDPEPLSADFSQVDFYKQARDSFLSRVLVNYPNVHGFDLSLNCSISSSAKNGVIIHAILDAMPDALYTLDKSQVTIDPDFNQLGKCMQAIADIFTVCKTWKSTSLLCNGVTLNNTTLFYLIDFCEEKHFIGDIKRNTIEGLRLKYIKPHTKRRSTKQSTGIVLEPIQLSRNDPARALDDVVNRYIDLFGRNKDVQYYSVKRGGTVLVIEDSLILYFWLSPRYWAALHSPDHRDWEYPYIMIQELTHNDLFKFNYAAFRRNFLYDYIDIDFHVFHGHEYYRKEIDKFKLVNKALPELKLQERLDKYPGEIHHFIILRMEDVDGNINYGIGVTKNNVHSFILKLCKEFTDSNKQHVSCLSERENRAFLSAFWS